MQFADHASARSSDCLEQLLADPELEQAVGDQDGAGTAGVVPPHADLLVVDADDAIAGHPPADPLLSVAFAMSQLIPDFGAASAKAALGRGGWLPHLHLSDGADVIAIDEARHVRADLTLEDAAIPRIVPNQVFQFVSDKVLMPLQQQR